MYFIQPTRDIPHLDQVLDTLPSVQMIRIEDLHLYDPTIIAIADVQDYLTHQWTLPTIALALEDEGLALSAAWEQGALAGWIWSKLPANPQEALIRIDAKYKRNQDSRDLPSAAELQKKLLPNPIELLNYKIETLFQPSAYLSGDWYDYWKLNNQSVSYPKLKSDMLGCGFDNTASNTDMSDSKYIKSAQCMERKGYLFNGKRTCDKRAYRDLPACK